MTIVSDKADVLFTESEAVREAVNRKFIEKRIKKEVNGRISKITEREVHLTDGRVFECEVPIWATGAEPQEITRESSEVATMNGYFRVNDFLQSTSHPNIFAAGDCITMETYAEKHFPPKAGVYAVRAGPIIAQNLVNYLKGEPLVKYVPQSGFLSLLMTGDGKAIGTKFGIAFTGRWVWNMKDYIDVGFMKMFYANYLFEDPIKLTGKDENCQKLATEMAPIKERIEKLRAQVAEMDPETAARWLLTGEEEEDFHVPL